MPFMPHPRLRLLAHSPLPRDKKIEGIAMTKQIAVVATLLLTLGVSFAETVRVDANAKAPTGAIESVDISSRATVQVASLWAEHEKVNSPTRLARPL
jgi:hypothetical protein